MLTSTFLITALLGQPCANGLCRPRSAETPHPSVVRILNEQGRERIFGSGTLVATNETQGLVISCAHLFREYTGRVTVTFPDNQSFIARVLDIDPATDLSALLISKPGAPAAKVALELPRIGDALASCGYGPLGQFATNHGRALGYVSLNGHKQDVLELTGAARQGDSGGPIWNARGELAAVLFGTDGQRVDGTHCGAIRQFLKPHLIQKPEPIKPISDTPKNPSLEPRLLRIEKTQQQIQAQLAAMLQNSGAPCLCDPTLPDRIARLEASRGPSVAVPPPHVPASDPSTSGGASWAFEKLLGAKLTAILVGLGLPGGAAAVATWLITRRAKKRLRAIVVHDQPPPLPQIIERDRQFVEVQVPTDRLGALEWAMDEYVKRNPGARPTVETIESYAKQFQAAIKKAA